METKDSNGTVLNDGDSVILIQSLKLKGSSTTLKRETVVKKIRLTSDNEAIEGKADGQQMVLKTSFLKKM